MQQNFADMYNVSHSLLESNKSSLSFNTCFLSRLKERQRMKPKIPDRVRNAAFSCENGQKKLAVFIKKLKVFLLNTTQSRLAVAALKFSFF